MPKNIFISLSGIITINYLFNRLNRNTASRVISLFEMPNRENYQFCEAFLLDDSAQKI